ncbi:hypothetical protein [Rhizobium paknamense]|uniref:Uncharacterized protein n=1 Tax=Rhizobium paknamense TaxID=1206817 RepID=A0ABU0IAT1_9HYPH|nr:hypothetical protein [Rhizobium paknamense]MDQ0454359.1 hypothetical protein [Rhizobium paknamense]
MKSAEASLANLWRRQRGATGKPSPKLINPFIKLLKPQDFPQLRRCAAGLDETFVTGCHFPLDLASGRGVSAVHAIEGSRP